MGIRLVTAAELWAYPRLGRDNAAKIALAVMARHAHDLDNPPWYGLGHGPIARALGYPDEHPRGKHQASRAVRALVDAKLIERTYTTPQGNPISRSHAACWILRIEP